MNHLAQTLFWVGLIWLFYVYAGYPLILGVLGLFVRRRSLTGVNECPRVSVLISARNESKDIGWKVRETLSWNYPPEKLELLVASDASEDGTDAIVAGFEDARLRLLRLDERVGKNEALNRLQALATGDLLFFSDANSHIESSCLKQMVRHFADRRVGAVTGTEHTVQSEEVPTVAGSRAFLGYESFLNRLESKLGSVCVCDGSIFCIRRDLFHELDPDLANDLELPVRIGSAGFKILYEPNAISLERATTSWREDFQRRRRICSQGALAVARLRRELAGIRGWQFGSRKVLRWLGLIPVFLMLVGTLLAAAHGDWWLIAAIAEFLFLVLAACGWLAASHGEGSLRLAALPFYFLLAHSAALTGVMDACRRKRFRTWEIPAASRGTTTKQAEAHR